MDKLGHKFQIVQAIEVSESFDHEGPDTYFVRDIYDHTKAASFTWFVIRQQCHISI